ncbi:MAG: helix-turn-helix transcriptional regulator [Spirochaetaceae bacterium]|nr:helix-turn-helix transcriptional regulator [Spirochaetaceae bacterium]
MQHLILAFYVFFFSTGFMGAAALVFLRIRSGERLLGLFLAFQILFVLGLALVGVYFYMGNVLHGEGRGVRGIGPGLELAFGLVSSLVNGSIYLLAVAIARRLEPAGGSKGPGLAAQGLAALVVVETAASVGLAVVEFRGSAAAGSVLSSPEWHLGGYLLTGLAIAAFGFVALGASAREERPSIKTLLRGYGICALAFAPLGFAEWGLNQAGVQPWKPLSLDYLFYLGWNAVALVGFARSLKRGDGAGPVLGTVPEETAKALGLTARELDMALLIARGLANKEIAAELGISAATVRTHIYNLYRKVGARSRVELINRLRA